MQADQGKPRQMRFMYGWSAAAKRRPGRPAGPRSFSFRPLGPHSLGVRPAGAPFRPAAYPQGTVSLGAYEVSGALKRAGAISGHDLTTEAAVAKLYYLFSRGLSRDAIKASMELDLRGELSIHS